MEILLDFTRQWYWFAEITERLARCIELFLSFDEPVFELDVVRATVSLIYV